VSAAWLEGELTTVAFCWRLDRRDGVALGFTGHDRDLWIGGLLYRSAPGMTPSAIGLTDGLDVDTLDVTGALTSDAITAEDLASGRWDGAQARLFALDWTAPEAGQVALARGELGNVGIRDGAFSAELRGPTASLERPAAEMTSPECRASLGDRRCRVDLAPRTQIARIVDVTDETLVTIDVNEAEPNAYAYGRIGWLDGENGGLIGAIRSSDGAQLRLAEQPPFPIIAGAMIRLTQGCNRTLATCRDRFANAVNFRGEPYLPGNDLLTRYPGA
jgi:uncharacterized phage protein (TIGR02218 family)